MTVKPVAAAKVRERRIHLEAALANVADAVIAVDAAGRVAYLNPAAELITAWNSADAVGLPLARCFKIVHDDTGAALDSVFDSVRKSGEKADYARHVALVNRRGILVPIECSASPIRDGGDAFAGAVIVFRDVGGRRAAERALQSSEESRAENADALFEEKERAQVTLNSIGDAVVSTNFWGRVTYLNIVAERMTGWSQAQASGRAVDDVFRLINVTTRSPIPTPTASAIIEDRTVGLGADCMLVRGDGVELAIETSAAPIHDRLGGVIGAVMVAHDVTVARELSNKLARLALHDSLTDVPNRTLLSDRLHQAMMRAHRTGSAVAVLYIDLDRFKHINDSLGHAVGDELLRSVAQRLLSCVRSSDTVSRQGGDEFLILLADVVHPHDAAVCAEKIIAAARGAASDRRAGSAHQREHRHRHVSRTMPTTRRGCMRNADFAMYQAKYTGRNNYQYFRPEMNANAIERQSVETDLRQAVARGEFVMNYQPKVNLETGAVVGVEALIRWNRPQYGVVLPARFIPIAEESGLILPIGRWALETTCRQARAWRDRRPVTDLGRHQRVRGGAARQGLS